MVIEQPYTLHRELKGSWEFPQPVKCALLTWIRHLPMHSLGGLYSPCITRAGTWLEVNFGSWPKEQDLGHRLPK